MQISSPGDALHLRTPSQMVIQSAHHIPTSVGAGCAAALFGRQNSSRSRGLSSEKADSALASVQVALVGRVAVGGIECGADARASVPGVQVERLC